MELLYNIIPYVFNHHRDASLKIYNVNVHHDDEKP